MGRGRVRRVVSEETVDRDGFAPLAERHLEHLRVIAYSEETVEKRREQVMRFARWCEERAVSRPSEVTRPILERYQRHLYHRREEGRRAAVVFQPARRAGRAARLLRLARAAEPPPLQPRRRARAAAARPAPAPARADRRGGRARPRAARRQDAARPARPRDPRDALLDGDPAHRALPPRALRRRPRARHGAGAPGQGQEGPHGADRRARARLDREAT